MNIKNCCILKKLLNHNAHKDYTFLGKGFTLEDKKGEHFIPIFLEDNNRCNHSFIFGAPGVGKTRLLEAMIEQDIPKGNNIVVIDPKGDIDLFSKIYQCAKLSGREKDVLFLSPVYPQYSIQINPLKNYYMEEELISHVMSAVPAKDEFFYNVAYEVTTAIIKALLALRRASKSNEPLTFEEIASKISYEEIKNLAQILQGLKDSEEKIRLISLFNQILSSPQDYFSKVTSTLRTTLTQVSIGNTGKIIGSSSQNYFIDRLEKGEGVILYIQTGSLLTRSVSNIISKLTISMIQSLVGRLYASGDKFNAMLNLYIDEMASSVYKGIETLYAQGRAANVAITGLTQSTADIVSEIGKDQANRLFDNTSTKIIMRMNDNESAKKIASLGGIKRAYSHFLSIDGGINSREVELENILATDIMRLKKREFYYFGFEGEFKGKTAPVSSSELRIIMPKLVEKEVL